MNTATLVCYVWANTFAKWADSSCITGPSRSRYMKVGIPFWITTGPGIFVKLRSFPSVLRRIQIDIHLDTDPEVLFDIRTVHRKVVGLLKESPINSLRVNFYDEDTLQTHQKKSKANTFHTPSIVSGLSYIMELPESDLEFMLQPLRGLRQVGKCHLGLLYSDQETPPCSEAWGDDNYLAEELVAS